MPVAQIVAGFSKVFVGEIVEKGVSVVLPASTLSHNHPFNQRAWYKSDAVKQDHSLPTTCVKHTACTRRKRVVSAPRVRCALSGSSPAEQPRWALQWFYARKFRPPCRHVCFCISSAP